MIDLSEQFDFLSKMPLFLAYAETHYRFKFFPFSLYYRRQPEIIFDAPFRLEPNRPLPLYLIIKDAHKFPIEINEIHVKLQQNGESTVVRKNINEKIDRRLWHKTFEIELSHFYPGMISVDASVSYVCGKKRCLIHQDNHPRLSHKPFNVYLSEFPAPHIEGWRSGEIHCHTEFGEDQVEFGAPLEIIQSAAEASGLDWVALTDHSYNLDDLPDNCLVDDPKLRKWNDFLRKTGELNRHGDVLLIPGEELTCRSVKNRNVHLLMIGQRNFVKGSGDDAQNWLKTRSEHSVEEALNLSDSNAFLAAAHPFSRAGFLERLLINRGRWKKNDLNLDKLKSWQIYNGKEDSGFVEGLDEWKRRLESGARKYIAAGNDAHGSFNRFRQVKLPMLKLWENEDFIFGKGRTLVHIDGNRVTEENILNSLNKGKIVISNGPVLDLRIVTEKRVFQIGQNLDFAKAGSVIIRYKSVPEFGTPSELIVYSKNNDKEFEVFRMEKFESKQNRYEGKFQFNLKGNGYIRSVLKTKNTKNQTFWCIANPIWDLKSLSSEKKKKASN